MSDKVDLKVASKESVAFELAQDIAIKEKLHEDPALYRKRFLDLYVECLNATTGFRSK
ncbi:hypothetical protein O1D97_11310 [Marinomonas sp. 15G1-11]|uniref:Uncharacterized protein n=1 Tax=Marinomonas phaeophyticola TaxID=3004091 RepID=A0ABT4JV32_9GAMM|nr:hypothetical protein [Marinomonas sp. 15G1-11]MCZ2722209.1 hypothetical protein [Marinomonas sp. 15G1-11]